MQILSLSKFISFKSAWWMFGSEVFREEYNHVMSVLQIHHQIKNVFWLDYTFSKSYVNFYITIPVRALSYMFFFFSLLFIYSTYSVEWSLLCSSKVDRNNDATFSESSFTQQVVSLVRLICKNFHHPYRKEMEKISFTYLVTCVS